MAVPIEDKKLLIARYADMKFSTNFSPEYQCNRCDKFLITHYISNCDHKFCLTCKEILSDKNKTWRCPHCQEILKEIDGHDEKFEKKLLAKTVPCPNKKYGCQIVNSLKELATHLKVCDFKEEVALLDINIGKKTMDDINKNMKKLNKNFEKSTKAMTSILEKLEQLDNQVKENRKEMDIKLEEMKNLVSKSAEEFEENKSSLETRFKNLEQGNDDSINSIDAAVKSKLVQLESNILFMKLQSQSSSLLDDLWKHEPDCNWEIYGLKNKIHKGTFEVESAPFELPHYSMTAIAKLQLKDDDNFYISLSLTSGGNNSKKPLGFTFPPAVYYILKTNGGLNDRDIRWNAYYLLNTDIVFKTAYTQKLVDKSKMVDPEYYVESSDRIVLEIHVEPPEVAKTSYSTDGTLVWAIDNYRKRKQMEDDNLVQFQMTPYFYTSPNGYRVQAHVCLNGDEKYEGKGLTFAIRFVDGEGGKDLKESFPHKTAITIINPSEPSDFFGKSVDRDIKTEKEYEINMLDYDQIEKFTQKDTLFFKIQIKET